MTDDLIKRLREEPNYQDIPVEEAADALEAKDDEIQNLENRLRVALDAVKEDAARIAALEAALKEALDYIDDPYDELAIQIGTLLDRAAMEGK